MTEETEPRIVNKQAAQAISQWSICILEKHVANVPQSQLVSSTTAKSVSKRLSKKGAKRFETVSSLPLLVSSEVLTLCERIRIYPFVAKYREALRSDSPEMTAAWQLHSHSLRQSELYVIQERGGDILDFAHHVAADMGLGTANRSKEFEKRFKKQFEWRLRDRHRVVHAHEKPSMTSRLTDLMITTNETTEGDAKDFFMGLLVRISDMLPGEKTDDPKELTRRLQSVRDTYVKDAEEEAYQMMKIFVEELKETIAPATSAAAK